MHYANSVFKHWMAEAEAPLWLCKCSFVYALISLSYAHMQLCLARHVCTLGFTFNQICPALARASVWTGVCAHASTIVIGFCVCVRQGCGAHWLRAARLNREDTLSSRPQLWHFPSPLRAPLVWVRFVFPHSSGLVLFTASNNNSSFSDDWHYEHISHRHVFRAQLNAVIDNSTLQKMNMISLPQHTGLSMSLN